MIGTQILLPNANLQLMEQHYKKKKIQEPNLYHPAFITVYTYRYVAANHYLFKALTEKFSNPLPC